MNRNFLIMWAVTILALFGLARYNLTYAIVLAVALTGIYVVKYINSKKKS